MCLLNQKQVNSPNFQRPALIPSSRFFDGLDVPNIMVLVHIKPVLLMILFLCIPLNAIAEENKLCDLVIINKNNKSILLRVEIADNIETRGRGLMFRKELKENDGMLFVYRNKVKRNFWMKNTYIPLSIAYINGKGIINEIYEMKPLDTSITYPSIMPAKYVLEVNKGWYARNNITRGCKIIFDGCFGR